MTDIARVDLIFFDGCPNADQARANIAAAFERVGVSSERATWSEWDLMSEDTPDALRHHGSPTVLVGGVDVTGAGAGTEGVACRADGTPSVGAIAKMLR